MNESQRKFLIKKIEESAKAAIKALEVKGERPSVSNYLLGAVMANTFQIKPEKEIKKIIRQKALKSDERHNWMGGESNWRSTEDRIAFDASEIFILPQEYIEALAEFDKKKKAEQDAIRKLELQRDGLITRIQLASNKTLQTMIDEVDDMGNLSLMDSKMKFINR